MIIAAGRLVHASSLGELADLAEGDVYVEAPDQVALRELCDRRRWQFADEGRGLRVLRASAAELGAAAFADGVELHQLTTRGTDLEAVFLRLTAATFARRAGRCCMKAALRAEHRKLISTRLWWVLLILSAAYLMFIGATLAFSLSIEEAQLGVPDVEGVDAAASVYSLVNAVGYVFPLVVGSLLMTSEFRHRTITQSLLVEPRRTVLLVSKLLIAIPVGLVYGIVGVGAIVAGGAPVLAWRGDGAFLTDAEIIPVLLLGVVVTVLWTVVGVAFGSLVSNQVAAIVIILAVTQLVEPIARLGLGAVDALDAVGKFLPGAAADAVMGAGFLNDLGDGDDLLPRWAGLLVFSAYAALLAVLGRLTTLRRDIG